MAAKKKAKRRTTKSKGMKQGKAVKHGKALRSGKLRAKRQPTGAKKPAEGVVPEVQPSAAAELVATAIATSGK